MMDFNLPDELASIMWNRIYSNPDAPDLNISFAQYRHNIACAMMGEEPEALIYTARKRAKKSVQAKTVYTRSNNKTKQELINQLFRIGITCSSRTRTSSLRLFLRDGGCLDCNSKDNLTRDHIYPISRGGGSGYDNLQTLCVKCNSDKANKIIKKHLDRIPEIKIKNKQHGLI